MSREYKVSMIVPVYNAGKYLEQCINSLLSQTYQNVEILLIDDGSTDDSGRLCDCFAKEHSQIRVFHKKNGGLVSSWKYGVEQSSGEYLCFIDSDDWVEPQMISEMMQEVTGNQLEVIASDYVIERDNGTSEPVYQGLAPGEYYRERLCKEVFPYVLGQEKRQITISRCMKLIARTLILNNMHYSEDTIRMGEDMTIMLPVLFDCERLVIMNHKTYYHYRYVTMSMVHQYDKTMYENNRQLRRIIRQVLQDKFQGEERRFMEQQAQREYMLLLLLALKNEARGNPKGCYRNITGICRQQEVRELVHHTDIEVHEKANKLLYFVLKHPNVAAIWVLRLAIIWYYR